MSILKNSVVCWIFSESLVLITGSWRPWPRVPQAHVQDQQAIRNQYNSKNNKKSSEFYRTLKQLLCQGTANSTTLKRPLGGTEIQESGTSFFEFHKSQSKNRPIHVSRITPVPPCAGSRNQIWYPRDEKQDYCTTVTTLLLLEQWLLCW